MHERDVPEVERPAGGSDGAAEVDRGATSKLKPPYPPILLKRLLGRKATAPSRAEQPIRRPLSALLYSAIESEKQVAGRVGGAQDVMKVRGRSMRHLVHSRPEPKLWTDSSVPVHVLFLYSQILLNRRQEGRHHCPLWEI